MKFINKIINNQYCIDISITFEDMLFMASGIII